MNRWSIPKWLEAEIRARDIACIYCGVAFSSVGGHGSRPSWEHIVNDAKIVTRENIALCCCSCNSSKGSRLLADWIASPYCKRLEINCGTVAEIVKKALLKIPN